MPTSGGRSHPATVNATYEHLQTHFQIQPRALAICGKKFRNRTIFQSFYLGLTAHALTLLYSWDAWDGLGRLVGRVEPRDHPMFMRFGTTGRLVRGVRVPLPLIVLLLVVVLVIDPGLVPYVTFHLIPPFSSLGYRRCDYWLFDPPWYGLVRVRPRDHLMFMGFGTTVRVVQGVG